MILSKPSVDFLFVLVAIVFRTRNADKKVKVILFALKTIIAKNF